MKKLFSIALILFAFCSFSFGQELKLSSKKLEVKVTNHSFLTEEHVGSNIKITGLLTVNKKNFVLTENDDSRSAVTFNLVVKKSKLKRQLKKLNGQKVTVSGELLEASSTWTKKMKVLSIE